MLQAWSGGSSDDNFAFSWSTDNINYTGLFVVSSTDPSNTQSAVLPGGVNGTVYIRVEDTDRTPGNRSLDTVFVDHLYIRAASGAGDPPAAPSSLLATTAGSDQIDLQWTDNATDEAGFKVERSTDGISFGQVGSAAIDATGYSDSGLAGSTSYWYRVSAWNASGDSPYSNVDSATTDPAPAITLSLNGYKIKGRHTIDLTWGGTTAPSLDIFRDGALLLTVPNSGAYTDATSNKGGRTYIYRLCEAGTANCSAQESVTF